jgi:DNA-binding beta-propeller fold protein YncE
MNVFAAVFAFAAALSQVLPLWHVRDLALPGNATRLDYQSLDEKRGVLFIAHLGDSSVIAVDIRKMRVLGTISGVASVHGVLAVPSRSRVYASATGTNELVAIDESTLRVVGRTAAGVYPDGIAYDPQLDRLYVSDEQGGTDTAIDARTFRVIGRIALGGEVGNTQYDPRSHHIFVNAEGAGTLDEIDPQTNRIVARTPLPRCAGNHGLLVDPVQPRFFVACEDNATLIAVNRRGMRIEGRWQTGGTPDVLAMDPLARVLYVASESGTVSVFRDARKVTELSASFFAPDAHTVAVEAAAHLVYFPLENVAGRPVLRVVRGPAR